MFRFRALLLWVVMFAVPLQGYAAATMAFCALPQPTVAAADATEHSHDHSKHHHGEAKKQSENEIVAKASTAEPDSLHKCGTCGTCGACHATALLSTPLPVVFSHLPQDRLAESFDAIATLPLHVPDKPPRA